MVVYFLMVMLAFPGLIQHSVSVQSIDVRLNNGSSRNNGTLQLLIPAATGGWQTHCGTQSSRFVSVICRMLGYNTNGISYSGGTILYGIYLRHYFTCDGDEATIADCRSNGYSRSSYCYPTLITCPTCPNGAVRLTGGLVPQQGNVEVCLNGTWSRVCYQSWDHKDSFVVCRQLGYPATQPATVFSSQNSHIGFVPSSNAYNCIGNESSLLDCNYVSQYYCRLDNSIGSYGKVDIFCRGNLVDSNQCSPGAIRLSGGRDQFEGRVEMCSNGVWGTVSRTGWDSNDATVACRQLGLLQTNGIVTRVTVPTFGPGVGPILLYDVHCTGSERRLADCPSGSYYYGTFHNDAGVRCQFNQSPVRTCTFGEVRLVGGNSSSEGQVEMCYRGVWGSICYVGWNNIDAAIVCRQLGFQGENSTAIRSLEYGEASGPYLLSSVGCRGHERNLTECSYGNSQIGYHTCSSGQDAGVRCDATSCNHGDVRLYGGYSRADGAAQVCINGLWASICYQDWDETDSRVFCKQLLGKENNITTLYSSGHNRISPTTNTTLINVACSNRVNSRFVRDCTYGLVQRYPTSSCSSSSSVIVGCYAIDNCANGSIRLTGGSMRSEGVVEICLDGVWGTIPHSFFPTFAEVVCRQLGFPWQWSYSYGVPVTQSKLPHIRDNVYCNGNEDTLLNCSYYSRFYGDSALDSIRYYQATAVTCEGNQGNFSQGSVFRVTVISNTTGPVQLGDVVKLHCSISPDPSIGRPVRLRYRWRGNNGRWSADTFSPNVTLTVHVTRYETSYYFCSVSIGNHMSAVGSTIIKIKDLLIPVLKVSPIESEEQNNLTLGVNITSDSTEYIMRNLNWYFNGNSIGNSSNTIISNGNKTLTTTNGIAGEYEVRYDGLFLNNPYDSTCEKMILKTLRHHPLFKPVKFLISTKEVMNRKPEIDIQFNGGIGSVITFTNGDNFTLKAVGQLVTSIEPSEVNIVWYFNGRSVGSSSRVRNRNSISRDLRRTSSTYLHNGIYEALLVWNMNQECSSYYGQTSYYGGLYSRVILARTSVEVKYYDSLDHSFSADRNVLFSSEAALLRCSATIRYPPLSSISIVKNNITLQTTTGTTLSVRTGAFGLYQCRVNATGVIFLLEMMIKEKAHLRIQFQVRGPMECREDIVFMGIVKSSVVTKLREDCSCNISVNHLQNFSLQCNNAQTATFSTLVVFSSDNGDETASTLTSRFSSAASLNLNGSEVLITSANIISDSSESNIGIYVGLFFGGILTCAFLVALLVMTVFLMYRKKSSKKPPKDANATKGEARYSNRTGECHIEEKPKVLKKPIAPAKTILGAMQPNESYAIMSVQQEADTIIYECVN